MDARAVVLSALSRLGGSGTRDGTPKERQGHGQRQAGGGGGLGTVLCRRQRAYTTLRDSSSRAR